MHRDGSQGGLDPRTRTLRIAVGIGVTLDPVNSALVNLGDFDLSAATWLDLAQMLTAVAATWCVLFYRVVPALVLGAATAVLMQVTGGWSGPELWLVAVASIMVLTRASWTWVGLYLAGVLTAAATWLLGDWTAPEVLAAFLGYWLVWCGVGLALRLLIRARNRRRERAVVLAAENALIRHRERLALAGDVRDLVESTLRRTRADVAAHAASTDDGALRELLERVGQATRTSLSELRGLLALLRPGEDQREERDEAPAGQPRAVTLSPTAITSAVAGLAAIGAGWLAWTHRASILGGDVSWLVWSLGILALGALPRSPRAAAGIATAALAFQLTSPTTGAETLPPLLVLAVCAFLRALPVWASCAVVGVFVAASLLRNGQGAVVLVPVTQVVLIVGAAIAWAWLDFERARGRDTARITGLERERVEIPQRERAELARELHDVVAHQLSVTSLYAMTAPLQEDPRELRRSVAVVADALREAEAELADLTGSMAGERLQPAKSVTQEAERVARMLASRGIVAQVRIDPAIDDVDAPTAHTLARAIRETGTNALRYAPPGSRCRYDVVVAADRVQLEVRSALGGARRSDLSTGSGLRGLRERVDLSGGTFRAGPVGEVWVVAITLPLGGAGGR